MVLTFKKPNSPIDSLTKLNIFCLQGERQRGESWALENIFNPTPGSQGQAVCSNSFQIGNIITVVTARNTYTLSYVFCQCLSEPLLSTEVHPLALDYGIGS